jgi:DNA replication protein DnaC
MDTDKILNLMLLLKLKGMYARFKHMLEEKKEITQDDLFTIIGILLEAEIEARNQRSQELLFKNAKLKKYVLPANIECNGQNGLSKSNWQYLCEGHYLQNKTNLIITGKVGVGKTYVAQALAYQACASNYKTLFFNMNILMEEIRSARLQGIYMKLLNQLIKVSLLVIDDFGLFPLEEDILIALYDIMEARNGVSSTIFTSAIPFGNWYDLFEQNLNLGESFLDRLRGSGEQIELKGESRRGKKKPK